MNKVDTYVDNLEKLTKVTGDYYSDVRIQQIFMALFGPSNHTQLHATPFYLLDAKNGNNVVLSCSGVDGWSFGISSDKDKDLILHFTSHMGSTDRGYVIEAFLELETIIDHLLMIKIGAYSKEGDSAFASEVFSKMSIPAKLQLAKQKRLIPTALCKLLNKLADYRNKVAHLMSVSNLEYKEGSVSNEEFYKDCKNAKNQLRDIYSRKQDCVIDYLLSLIEIS